MNRLANVQDTDSLTDEQIVQKVVEGNVDLFEVIVRRYNQQIYRITCSYLTNEDDVKDVMQTAYLKAFKNLKQFRAEAQFSTWLIRIVINEALKILNQNKRTSDLHPVTRKANLNLISSNGLTPESKAMQNDMNRIIEQAIERLPPKYRSVFIMREIEQMSTKETSDCLNISRVNVKVRLYRAKNMLQKDLSKAIGYGNLFSFRGIQCDAMTEQIMRDIRLLVDQET